MNNLLNNKIFSVLLLLILLIFGCLFALNGRYQTIMPDKGPAYFFDSWTRNVYYIDGRRIFPK
jgi:hypothetical protein